MEMRSRRKFVNSMMAAAAVSPMLIAQDRGTPAAAPGRGGQRAAQLRPAGIVWISGTGIERQTTPPPWDLVEHTRLSMANVKTQIERLGGTMNDFLYMQVFFCLHMDDSSPTPTGSAANAAYQKGYTDIAGPYNAAWRDAGAQAPPRSCFALSWIPGNSLFECVGAAYIDPNKAPAAGA